ncbi:MAG: SAM-dependent methyltransferase [Bacteroidota bacterium]
MSFDKAYWNNRYLENKFSWDLGSVSPPLKNYFDQLTNKSISILIPGAGNAYEAEYLINSGFINVCILDFADEPLNQFKFRNPKINSNQVICQNFFDHIGQYDLIIEQTFFCALDPLLRKGYAEKIFNLLKPNGKLVGVLFNDFFNGNEPPFGGNKEEYLSYFNPLFKVNVFESCYNSVKPRMGRELFINFQKP